MSRLDPLAVSRGTDGSNPASSSVESANYQFRSRQAASAVSSMEDPLGDVQTECGNLHGGRLLQLVALNGPSLAHRCRQGSSTASDFNRWVKGNAAKGFEPKDGEGGRGDCLPEHDAKLGERLISAGREPGQ